MAKYSAHGPGDETFDTTQGAWTWLWERADAYVERLSKVDALTTHAADWGMFCDDLYALTFLPWERTGLVTAPDGEFWKVAMVFD